MLLLVLAVVSLTLSTVALAVYLAEIKGPEIIVIDTVSANIQYSDENVVGATWTLPEIPLDQPWYVRMETNAEGYAGEVLITWVLQYFIDSSWTTLEGLTGLPVETTYTLSGAADEIIYASSDGTITTNFDFGSATTATGTYRVLATIEEYTS